MIASLAFPMIDPVALALGPIRIRWYGLAYLLGLLIAWWLGRRLAPRFALASTVVDDMIFYSTLGVVLGGRLGFVFFYEPSRFLHDPASILALWQGGMSFHGGFLGVVLAALWTARKAKIPLASLADLTAMSVPIGLFFGRWANFINGELWGRPTNLPWGIVFPAADSLPRHPSQIYEACVEGLLPAAILITLAMHSSAPSKPWLLTSIFLILYGSGRFLVEFTRAPHGDFLAFDLLSLGQMYSLPMLAIGCILAYCAIARSR